jgi:quercetin dioxygenase-like cupin family protein
MNVRTTLIVALAGLFALPVAAMDDHVSLASDQLKWSPISPAYQKGAEMAVLAGDPTKDGQYVIRIKAPAGYRVAPHSHPFDEHVTVISGSLILDGGDKLNDSKAAIKAGAFVKMPKGMVHYAIFPELTIIQVHGRGPQGITYMNPSDDPRKQN